MPSIKAGALSLEYYVDGSGPPLLMIMGFAGQAKSWGEPIVARLAEHFTCVRFSNRGTGSSDRPDEPTTIRQMAGDAIALLDALGIERPHVFGVSMGGMIAQELAINYPQRVNGLVLGCTTAGFMRGPQAGADVAQALMPVPGLTREEQVRKAWPAICAPDFIATRMDFLEAMLTASLAQPTPIETIAKQVVAVNQHDALDRLNQIKAPTLIIHGDVDRLVPYGNAPILHQAMPGSELRTLEGAAHMFFWEQPKQAADIIIEFLARVPAHT
jgi:pimeloyl-ACP methyl ester carboxylesterase